MSEKQQQWSSGRESDGMGGEKDTKEKDWRGWENEWCVQEEGEKQVNEKGREEWMRGGRGEKGREGG